MMFCNHDLHRPPKVFGQICAADLLKLILMLDTIRVSKVNTVKRGYFERRGNFERLQEVFVFSTAHLRIQSYLNNSKILVIWDILYVNINEMMF